MAFDTEIEIKTITDAIVNQFSSYSGLNYVRLFTDFDINLEVELLNESPWINVEIRDLRITDAPPYNLKQMERRIYPVVITFGQSDTNIKVVMRGDEGTKGVWNIYNDIRAAIKSDYTFSGVVQRYPVQYEVATETTKHPDGVSWLGLGQLIFEVYSDQWII